MSDTYTNKYFKIKCDRIYNIYPWYTEVVLFHYNLSCKRWKHKCGLTQTLTQIIPLELIFDTNH